MTQLSDLYHLSTYLPKTKMEAVTDTAALSFTASPIWLPFLRDTSEIAAFLLPIFGILWLAVQVICKIYITYKGRGRPLI